MAAINVVSYDESLDGGNESIPTIDYSMLISPNAFECSNEIEKLGKACLDYGFFIVTNHTVPEYLMKGVIDGLFGFFDLNEEQKLKYATNNPTDTIRSGKDDFNYVSREFLKFAAYPHFHCPSTPASLRGVLKEYHKNLREVGLVLLRGISITLGQEELYIEKAMKLNNGYDSFAANVYPPRDQSQKPIGQFPHVDPGLLILLIQNVSGGLQLQHKGNWVNVNINPNSIVVNIADHLEILTNGKYKSCVHRVIVNNEDRRVSLPLFIGPSLDTFVSPALEFVTQDKPSAYVGMTYKEYFEFNNYHVIDGKSRLRQIRTS